MDCTVPLGPEWNPNEFVRSTVVDRGDPPAGLEILTEEALTQKYAVAKIDDDADLARIVNVAEATVPEAPIEGQ